MENNDRKKLFPMSELALLCLNALESGTFGWFETQPHICCVSNHPKCLMDVNSDRVDLKNSLSTVSGQNIAKVAEGKLELAPNHSIQANSIRNSLNICFVLYSAFYIGFMLVLAIVAQKWWHELLGIAVMSPIHIWGLYLTSYLRDGLLRVHTVGLRNSGDDFGCKLLASKNM